MTTAPTDQDTLRLLHDIVEESARTGRFLTKADIESRLPGQPWHLDTLIERGWVKIHGHRVGSLLDGLRACDSDAARSDLDAARLLYPVLKRAFVQQPDKPWQAAELADLAGWSKGEARVGRLLFALSELPLFRSFSSSSEAGWVNSVMLGQQIFSLDPFAEPTPPDGQQSFPDIRVDIHDFRALRHASIEPDGVCLLAGPNGSGKSSLLAALAFLQEFYHRGTSTAVQAVRGATGLRHIHARAGESIRIALTVGAARWDVELAEDGPGIHPYAGELLQVDDAVVIRRASMSRTWYLNAGRRSGNEQCCLRLAYEAGDHGSEKLAPLIAFLQGYRYHPWYDLPTIRMVAQEAADEQRLETDGANLVRVLRNWQSAPRRYRDQFEWVMKHITIAFPAMLEHLEFDAAGQTVIARFYPRAQQRVGRSLPLYLASDGLLVGLSHLTAVAGAPDGAMIAIDEMENHLHPHAIRSILSAMRELADERNLTILLATHSPVLMNEFKRTPEQLFVTESGHDTFPVPLSELHDPDWLAHFSTGDLYDRLEFGAPESMRKE